MYVSARYLTFGFGLFTLLLSAAMIVYSAWIRDPGVKAFYMSSAFMPRVWLTGSALSSLAIMIRAISSRDKGKIYVPLGYLWKIVLLMVAYGIALPYLGYLASTHVFLMASARLMGERRWGIALIAGISFTVLGYLFFVTLLGVPVPAL